MSWPMVKLSDLVDIRGGGTPSRTVMKYWNGDIPWVTVKDIKDLVIERAEESITSLGLEESSSSYIPAGNIIIPTRMALGRVAINATGIAINQDIKALMIREPRKVDVNYLAFFLRSKAEYIISCGKGATVKGITVDVLRNIDVPLPDFSVQQSIVGSILKAENMFKQSQKMESELNTLAQAVFLDMFGDPVSNPLAWPKVSLDEIGEVQGGLQVTSKRASLPVKVDYLRVANVYKNELKLDEVKTIQVTQSELDRTRLKLGDMLVVEGHGNKDEIGRTAVWDGSIEDCTHQNHLIRVRFDGSVAVPEFVSRFLNSEGGRYQINKICNTTSGLNTISANNVRSLEVPLPPIHLQRKFVSFLNALILQASKNLEIQEYNKIIFKALMQRAFSGKLDLKKVA
ncbi:restriction endonuclease subunit S [Enterobacteriaceae bacterium H16N7]|nr:restriction endonuclease subunit S [Dryocola clanedunensis]